VAKLSAYKSAHWDRDKHEMRALKMSHSMEVDSGSGWWSQNFLILTAGDPDFFL